MEMFGLYFVNTKTRGNKCKMLESITACECNTMLSLVLPSEKTKSLHTEVYCLDCDCYSSGINAIIVLGPLC